MDIPGIISAEELARCASRRRFNKLPTCLLRDDLLDFIEQSGGSKEGFLFFFLLQGNDSIKPVLLNRPSANSQQSFVEFPWKNETDRDELKEVYVQKYQGTEDDFDHFFQEYDIQTFPDYCTVTRFLTPLKEDEERVAQACGVTTEELEQWFGAMLADIMTTDHLTCLISPELNKFTVISQLAAQSSTLCCEYVRCKIISGMRLIISS